jgi:hypothetical protein
MWCDELQVNLPNKERLGRVACFPGLWTIHSLVVPWCLWSKQATGHNKRNMWGRDLTLIIIHVWNDETPNCCPFIGSIIQSITRSMAMHSCESMWLTRARTCAGEPCSSMITLRPFSLALDRTHVPNLHIIMRRADWDRLWLWRWGRFLPQRHQSLFWNFRKKI